MAIFYCGLDKSKKVINPVPEVGKESQNSKLLRLVLAGHNKSII